MSNDTFTTIGAAAASVVDKIRRPCDKPPAGYGPDEFDEWQGGWDAAATSKANKK